MDILFIDCCCPAPYNDDSLDLGLGGSEASVVRLSRALEALGHRTAVMQHCRMGTNDGRFSGGVPGRKYDHIVVLRDPRPIEQVRAITLHDAPLRAPITLWVHDSAVPDAWGPAAIEMPAFRPIVVVPSEYMRKRFEFAYAHLDEDKRFPLHVIHNPVGVDGPRANPAPNFDKVLFASDPNRGLIRAVQLVLRARREGRPNLRLHVCRPSYASPLPLANLLDALPAAREAIVDLGVLSHTRVLDEMMTSACLFYPNASVPEAFGLVMAEANALGVPVLTHDLGAAREVVRPIEGQIVSMEPDTVIEHLFRVTDPNAQRLAVSLKPEFAVGAVAARWVEHFKQYAVAPATSASDITTNESVQP